MRGQTVGLRDLVLLEIFLDTEHRLSNDPEVSSTARRSTYIGTSGMKPMMLDKKTDTRVGGQKNDGEIEGQ